MKARDETFSMDNVVPALRVSHVIFGIDQGPLPWAIFVRSFRELSRTEEKIPPKRSLDGAPRARWGLCAHNHKTKEEAPLG
jgi:hypothetical protein